MSVKLPTKQPEQVGATTLYDPFLSGADLDGSWGKKRNPVVPERMCEVIGTDATEHMREIARQFEKPEPGWRVVQMAIPGFDTLAWTAEPRRDLIATLVPTAIALHKVTYVYLLPDHTAAMLIFEPEPKHLVKLVYKLAALLVDDAAAPQTRVTLTELVKQPSKLLEIAEQQELYLAKEATKKQQSAKLKVEMDTQFKLVEGHERLRAKRERPLILVVEDDPSTNLLLTTLLSREVEAHAAHDAVSAVEAYKRLVPDLVFLDIGLPDMDGLHLLERIKDGDPHACVVMLTANAFKQNIENAMKLGAKGFLAKPFTREKLVQALKHINKEA